MILDKSTIVSKTDVYGKITYVNHLFEKICQYDKDFLLGKTHRVIKSPSTPRDTFKSLWETISKGKTWRGIIKNRKKNKEESYYCQTTISPIKDEKGDIQEYISVCIDITEVIEQKDKINNILLTDNLTSLGSRVKLLEEVSKSKNAQIAFIDIDRFTHINDTLGNEQGDILLRDVAKCLYKLTNGFDVSTYRIYADVFVVYSESFDEEKFEEMIRSLVQKMSACSYGEKQDINFSFTTGIAYGDENMLVYADMALKKAKKEKKLLVIYDENSTELFEFEDSFKWVKRLSNAVEKKRIVPYFQPIYNYKTDKIEKYESLMRYIEEDGKEVSPYSFIEIAKKTRIYPSLTMSVVEQAVSYFKDKTAYSFSINLTLEDLLNKESMDYIYTTLKQHNLFANTIFEIVESEELESFEDVEKTLKRFKQKGVQIAIDDFGSGYSNYSYLLKLDVDFIKIDGSIIKDLLTKASAKDLVSSVVQFAQKSGIKTVAEFVSSEEISKIVQELGVDYAQGYYYGKPEKQI
jgi:diguanylate cyclase (GGDEF)-like protein